jgi:hypothetical protein
MIFRACERALRLPRKRRAFSNWKMSSRPPNVRVCPKPPIERMSDFRAPWLGTGPAENPEIATKPRGI